MPYELLSISNFRGFFFRHALEYIVELEPKSSSKEQKKGINIVGLKVDVIGAGPQNGLEIRGGGTISPHPLIRIGLPN